MIAQPTRIRGVLYPSQSAAAKALGLHFSTVQNALEQGREDTVGLGGTRNKPITIKGKTYPTIKAAAQAIGISYHRLWRNQDKYRDSLK